MLKKNQRLKDSEIIQRLLASKPDIKNGFFIIKYQRSLQKCSKFAIIISKKFKLSAVERNRLRRQIYDMIRTSNATYHALPSHNFLIISRNTAIKKPYSELKSAFITLLEKIHYFS